MSADPIVMLLGRNATLVVARAELAPGGWRITPGPHADAYSGKLDALSYKTCRQTLTALGSRSIDAFSAEELRAWDEREAAWHKAQSG